MGKNDHEKPLRCILIGLDGAIPEFILKFKEKLPNFKALMEKGVFAPALASPPTDTPTNWTTIVTGAWTGTHGITGFYTHLPGEPLDKSHWSFCSSTLCQAEKIWESLERDNRRSIVVNYPVAWPFKTKKAVIVGGDGVFSYVWQRSNPALFTTEEHDKDLSIVFNYRLAIRSIRLKKHKGWKNLPFSKMPCLEGKINISIGAPFVSWGERGLIVNKKRELPRKQMALYLLVFATTAKGYDSLVITKEKDCKQALTILKEKQWSPWVYLKLKEGEKQETVSVKFKLLKLSADGKNIRLYLTEGYSTKGWAYPPSVTDELIKKVGPYHEGFEHPPGLMLGWFGPETVFEQMKMQADWITGACKYLTSRYEWSLLVTQVHMQDYFNHQFLNYVHPGFPGYKPEEEKKYWTLFERLYKITDNLIGRIIENCADDETLVVVVSDHGAIPVRKNFNVLYHFLKEGLVSYRKDKETNSYLIDWSKTRVFTGAQGFWVNLKGREPHGIVNPQDYEKVRDHIIKTLNSIVDPETGSSPYSMIIRKEDASMLGLWGNRVPDVLCFAKAGYIQGGIPSRIKIPPKISGVSFQDMIKKISENIFSLPSKMGGHVYLPNTVLGQASIRAAFIMAGPGVKRNIVSEKPINLVDIAPTISFLIDAPKPANADGKILGEFLTCIK